MGSVQSRADNNNVPFILSGESVTRPNSVILQDAGRSAVLAPLTLMAKIAASQKWTPFIDETETDGAAIPQGVYIGSEISVAALVAGDIADANILVGQAIIDAEQLVIEAGKTLATIITVGTTDLRTVQDHLASRGIFVEGTVDISSFENS